MNTAIKTIIEKIHNNEPLTQPEKILFLSDYAMTKNHGGKMTGKVSFSTSVIHNVNCQKRQCNKKLICAMCYAESQLEYQKTTAAKMYTNILFFTQYALNINDVPYINNCDCRLEAFGDINNILQVKNFVTMCKKNKHCFYVLWSKNLKILKAAFQEIKKPENLRIIYSIPKINFIPTIKFFRKLKKVYPFIDKLFSVYTKQFAAENNIAINCGSANCNNCPICYHRENRTIFINELLKGKRK